MDIHMDIPQLKLCFLIWKVFYYCFNQTSSLICTTKSDGDQSEIQTANATYTA